MKKNNAGLSACVLVLAAIALPITAQALGVAATIDHLQPLGLSGQTAALIIKEPLQTGCPADAERRLTLTLPAPAALQGWLTSMRKAQENQQKLTLLIDGQCDAFGAAKVTQILNL